MSLVMFGLLFYVYNPVVQFLRSEYPSPAGMEVYANAMFFIWGALAAVALFATGISYIMKMQEQRGM